MQKLCYFLILMFFYLSGYALHGPKGATVIPPVPGGVQCKQYRQISAYDRIDVQGRINLHLHTGYKKPQLILTGDARDLAQVRTVVAQNKIFVSLGSGYPNFGEVNLDVRGPVLNGVRYVGAGMITGNSLYAPSLTLDLANQGTTNLSGRIGLRILNITGNGVTQISGISSRYMEIHLLGNPKVKLSGDVNLASLDIDGKASLSLPGVRSNDLTIRSLRGGTIELAGMVNRLDVELGGFARFNGRYLRAQRSFVKTHGRSVAEISSVNHQSTLATDASDIFYYNLPVTRADFMAFNGAVLDMREWDDPFIEDFTIYNHQYP